MVEIQRLFSSNAPIYFTCFRLVAVSLEDCPIGIVHFFNYFLHKYKIFCIQEGLTAPFLQEPLLFYCRWNLHVCAGDDGNCYHESRNTFFFHKGDGHGMCMNAAGKISSHQDLLWKQPVPNKCFRGVDGAQVGWPTLRHQKLLAWAVGSVDWHWYRQPPVLRDLSAPLLHTLLCGRSHSRWSPSYCSEISSKNSDKITQGHQHKWKVLVRWASHFLSTFPQDRSVTGSVILLPCGMKERAFFYPDRPCTMRHGFIFMTWRWKQCKHWNCWLASSRGVSVKYLAGNVVLAQCRQSAERHERLARPVILWSIYAVFIAFRLH